MKIFPAARACFSFLLVSLGAISPGLCQVRALHLYASHRPRAAASSVFAAAQSYAAGFGDAAQAAGGDFNGDGALDLAVVNPCVSSSCQSGHGSVAVLLGKGDGTFEPPVIYATGTAAPASVAVGDFNGDGAPDLVVASPCAGSATCGTGAVTVLLGKGDGAFQSPVTYPAGAGGSSFVLAGDFNGDGKLDLAVANQSGANNTVAILLGHGDGTFGAAANYSTGAANAVFIAAGDFNNDGALDLAVVNGGAQDSVSILLGNGDGTFQAPVLVASGGAFAHAAAVADFNGDGAPDLAVANGCADYSNLQCPANGSVGVLLGNGDGAFRAPVAYRTGSQTSAVAAADFDGDGVPDLVVADAGALSLLPGNGDGTFGAAATVASAGGSSVLVGDFNGDGRPDLAVTSPCAAAESCASGVVGVLLNAATGPGVVSNAVSLTANANPAAANQPVLLTATVSPMFDAGAVTGSVTFYDGSAALSTAPLSGGQASLSASFAAPGPHAVAAVYTGDANYAAGVSPALRLIAGTPVNLSSSAQPSIPGQAVTFTAAVSAAGGTAAGSVNFLDGAASLGTFPLVNGRASVSTPALAAGTHSISATYSGGAHTPSGAAALTQPVGQPSTIALASGANPASANQPVTFSATVAGPSGGAPTGVVAFMQGNPPTTWATAPLVNGQASVSNSFTAANTYPIQAAYLGSPNYQSSTSASFGQVVGASQSVTTTTAISSSGNPSYVNQPVTFTATVSPASGAIPNGETVTFYDGANTLGVGATAGGVAQFTTSSLTAGLHSITATYPGDATYMSSTSRVLSQVVSLNPTNTTLASSVNPATYGQAVTLTVTVAPQTGSGTPTGAVTLYNGQNRMTLVTLTNGTGSYTTSTLPAGSLALNATYSGDSSYATSSGALTQVVNLAATTTVLTATPNPSSINQTVTFTATVSGQFGGAPGGTVTFTQGAGNLGSAAPVNGKAAITASFPTAGTYAVTASYSGDANDTASVSAPLNQVVNTITTTTAVTSSGSPSYIGQTVTFTATVTPKSGAVPNGETVTFYDGSSNIGAGTTASGAAVLATSALAVGAHNITATYAGDATYQTSTSHIFKQSVKLNTTVVSLASSLNPSVYGQSVTLTATVAAGSGSGTPTGKVVFKNGSTALKSVTLTNGVATYTTAALDAGTQPLSVSYGGDANFAGGSAALSQVVSQATTGTTLASSANPSSMNQAVTFTATVVAQYGGSITGTVTFIEGSKMLGSGTVGRDKATFTLTFTTAGVQSITAVYAGDTNNQGSTSPVLNQTVTNSVTTTTLATSGSPANVGQSVTFTATVTSAYGAIPDGEVVTFSDGPSAIGTGNTAAGVAVFKTASLTAGTHSMTATYAGDSSFQTSTSKVVTQVIKANVTTTVLVTTSNPATYGAPVTFTATVTSAGPMPTGTVTFKNGTAALGVGALSPQGVTTLTTVSLGAGAYSITAAYSGDAASAKSTSAALNQVVIPAVTTTQLIASVNPASPGEAVTFTALVRSATTAPSGSVTFSAGSTVLGTATLAAGAARLTVSTLPTGSTTVTASYASSANVAGSSGSLTEMVN